MLMNRDSDFVLDSRTRRPLESVRRRIFGYLDRGKKHSAHRGRGQECWPVGLSAKDLIRLPSEKGSEKVET